MKLTNSNFRNKMSHRHWDIDCKIYIGGLKDDANRYDIGTFSFQGFSFPFFF